jgi:predicted ATPase
VYSLSAHQIGSPARVGSRAPLNREGSNAAEVLFGLASDAADKDWIVSHLAAITPGIIDVGVETHRGQRTLYFDQRPEVDVTAAPSAEPPRQLRFHAGEMSDGTLRALGILLACRQQPPPSLLLFDEIEDSLHVGAVHVILDGLGATVQDRCQVAITSHSTEVLGHSLVTPERTRLIVWRDGRSGIYGLDEGSRASAVSPDTVGSILRISGLYPAEEPTALAGDLFTLDDGDEP